MDSPRQKPQFSFRIVKSAPTRDIITLYKSAGWWDNNTSEKNIIPKVIRGSFAFAVAKNQRGKIVGMGRVISDGYSDAYIQDVVVLKNYRGQDIGKGLIRILSEYCRRKKIGWLGLVAEPGTYAFYRKLGFKDRKGYQLMLLPEKKKSRT